jgi:peptidoglycan hydrolase-like amidase
MSPFTLWNETLSSSAVQSRLSRYVRGIGTLYNVNIKQTGYSRRATELEIIGSNGTKSLKGGKIRSALRLKEQLSRSTKDTTQRVAPYPTHSPDAAGVTASECANTALTVWEKWASNTTQFEALLHGN